MKDLFAACLSVFCILHCLFTPLLLTLGGLGLLGSWLSAEWLHWVLLIPILLLLVLSLPAARHQHQQPWPLRLGVTGATVLVVSLWVPADVEPWLASAAGIMLMTAHLLNRYLLRQQLQRS